MSIEQFCIHEVVTVHPSITVTTAAARMATENVGALVVVDDRKPVGIVTDRDLVLRVLAKGRPADETEVRAVMTPDPVCINADAPLEGAISRMKSNRFRRLVVVNHQQEVVGILALDDIIERVAEERQALEGITGVMRSVRHEPLQGIRVIDPPATDRSTGARQAWIAALPHGMTHPCVACPEEWHESCASLI